MRPISLVRERSGGPTPAGASIPPSALRRSAAERVGIVCVPIALLWLLVFLSLVWWR